MSKKSDKVKMEEEMKSMQKHMAGLVRTIIDLKLRAESLEQNLQENQKDDVGELIEKQKRVDEAIAANTEAIVNIYQEIKILSTNQIKAYTVNIENSNKGRKDRKCRYYNRGHCKQKEGCQFFHPGDICSIYLEGGKCVAKECVYRHPKTCKYWLKSKAGCTREGFCDFLHASIPQNDEAVHSVNQEETKDFKCVGCETTWPEKRCIVTHFIQNQKVHFCLNCEDWVKDKSKVLDINWSLFDDKGNLRKDV